jgi:adenylate cyclase
MPLLKINSPEVPERTVELERHNTLGRHPENSIQILDRVVSKSHCHIDVVEGRYVLKDLGSLNGTYVNAERVNATRVLNPGDEISLGSSKLVFDPPVPVQGRPASVRDEPSRVTLAAGSIESHVRAKLSAQTDQHFVPEHQVTDAVALRRDYEKLRVSFELTRAIAGELDVDRLLAKILTTALQLLAVDRGVVLLLDARGKLQPRCVRTRRGESHEEVALSNTILGEVLRDRAAVLSSDAMMDDRFKGSQSIIMQGIRSSMAVPLLHADQLLGVMVLDSQVVTSAFTEKDLQLTQALANQAAVAIQNSLYAAKIEQEALTRQRFQRLLSPAIAELVVSGELAVEKGGQSRQASVFFSDIRGFTPMSERRTARQIVDMLNEYFELMVEVVFKYEGTLDKFVGDEIMALFGAPVSHPDDAYRAVKVAVEQVDALHRWNQTRIAAGEEPIRIGIGINSGEVVAGYLGSSKALEYTVIGDVVNIASRLCSTAQAGQILITPSTYQQVQPYFDCERMPSVQLKGKSQSMQIYRVLGERGGKRI